MEKETSHFFEPEISLEKDSYIETLKHNIEKYMGFANITIKELSEAANIPFATLNNLLYSKTYKDCKLSTVINLARAMEISVDELLGCVAMSEEDYHFISSMRRLPARTKYVVNWFLDYQIQLSTAYNFEKQKIINVMYPQLEYTKNLLPSDDFRPLDISNYPIEIKTKAFMGMCVSCDHYMPNYCPYDILLIANDRPAKPNEICVVVNYGHIHLAKRIERHNKGEISVQYVSLRDGLVRATDKEIEMVIGYVAEVYHDLRW